MSPRIAIIGAGPGGLTLASILRRHSIISTVFERDLAADYRPQGGTLDLHTNSGQLALREAGLWDEFLKHARYDAQTMKVFTKSGDIVFQDGPGQDDDEETRPEIDRTTLRELLLGSLDAENVKWGFSLSSVEPAAENKYDLHFKSGQVEKGFDLVVGADGAWSHVRPRITDVTPSYSGVSFIELNITDPTGSRYDSLNELLGQGSACGFNDNRGLMGQRLGTKGIRIYVAFGMEEVDPNWLSNHFDVKDVKGLKSKAMEYFPGWSPVLQDFIRLADDTFANLRPLYMLPVDHTWEARPGLTLLGDAAHLMTPFAGEGVNVTMWDSLELAKKIVEGTKSENLTEAVREYEVELFKRGSESMKRTDRNKKAFFASNFPESMAEMIKEIQGEGAGQEQQ